jgi:hypothetical protein
MLLLVVGLVVLVLVIVVVVFLSVRSMRADDEEEYPGRPARRESSGREPAGRDSAGRGSVSRSGASRSGASNSRASRDEASRDKSQRRGADSGRSRGGQNRPAQNPASGDYATAALPRPRGAQDDLDIAGSRRDSARRRTRQARAAEGRDRPEGRDGPGGDWSDTDWGGVSDEQYWAEMSSDKPLATTARSAQAGSDAAREDLGDRDAAGDSFPARGEAARSMAAAAVTTVGLRRKPRGAGQPDQAAEPAGFGRDSFRDEGSFRDADAYRDFPSAPGDRSDNTDPGLGGPGGWSGSDDTRTAAWSTSDAARWTGDTPGRGAWDRQDQPTTAWGTQDTQAGSWDTGHDQAQAPAGWAAEDPLTSASFATQDGYGTDGRSYRSSHDRTEGHRGHAADPYDDGYSGHAGQDGYGTHQNYDAHHSGYGADSGYPSGGLEPLPDQAGPAAAPRQTWHSAPVPADTQHGYTEPVSQGWDQGGSHYQDTPSYQDATSYQDTPSYQNGHEGHTGGYGYEQQQGYGHDGGYGYEQRQDYPSAGTQSWQEPQAGYGQDGGYGYDQQPGYGHDGYGYEQQGYAAPAANEYGHIGYDEGQADQGYGQHGRHGEPPAPGYSPEFDIGRRR